MSARVIQTFVRKCDECPHCHYYSGGTYQCGLTDERFPPDKHRYGLGERCPLPYAGPPVTPAQPKDVAK